MCRRAIALAYAKEYCLNRKIGYTLYPGELIYYVISVAGDPLTSLGAVDYMSAAGVYEQLSTKKRNAG